MLYVAFPTYLWSSFKIVGSRPMAHWLDAISGLLVRSATCRFIHFDPLNELLRASRGCTEPFDGIAEIFGDREEMLKAMSTPKGLQAMGELQEDEKNFIDFSRSAMWIAKEHVIFER